MNTLSKIMEGKKTITGIIIIVLGFVGFGDVISEADLAVTIDNGLQIAGIIIATYGRLVTKGSK